MSLEVPFPRSEVNETMSLYPEYIFSSLDKANTKLYVESKNPVRP